MSSKQLLDCTKSAFLRAILQASPFLHSIVENLITGIDWQFF